MPQRKELKRANLTCFFRKTRKNAVVKLVRERYLRSDIPCLSDACRAKPCCASALLEGGARLEANATHYLMPDVSVSTRFLELLEQEGILNIIVTQTVVDRLQHKDKHRSIKRLRQIIKDSRKRSILFNNKSSDQTYVARVPQESLPQWDWRALCFAAHWYECHINHRIPIVLLSEEFDRFPSSLDIDSNVQVMNVKDYLTKYWPDNALLQNLHNSLVEAIFEDDRHQNADISRNTEYAEYRLSPELEAGVKSGRFFSGIIHVNANNTDQAFVKNVESLDQDILIAGKVDRNRSVHGDKVVVELLGTRSTVSDIISYDASAGDAETAVIEAGQATKLAGKVVGVTARNWRSYVATVDEKSLDSGGSFHVVVPLDICIPKIRIRHADVKVLGNDRIVVRIDSWPLNSQYPNGHYVRSLGPIHQLDTEISAILVERGISVSQSTSSGFSEASLAEMPVDDSNNPWKPDPKELECRKDLRKEVVFSIDPPNCQDIDDALSIRELQDGTMEMGVHIADVSFFVKENTVTDLEARARGTTVYLADRRFDMLPKVLSERVCSLRSNQDRFAVSTLWNVTRDGDILSTWFGRTVIRSCCELEYEQAQKLLDGGKVDEIPTALQKRIKDPLSKLTAVLQKIRNRRLAAGALELESTEVKFKFSPKEGKDDDVSDIVQKNPLQVHKVIEEAMVLANWSVGKRIWESYKDTALLRRHPPPTRTHFKMLEKAAESRGFHIDHSSNKALAASLAHIASVSRQDKDLIFMIKTMATMAMSEAGYMSSGSHPTENYFHYGLALEFYTHFTSPIRRYADVVVHRQLLAATAAPGEVRGDVSANVRPPSFHFDGTKLTELCSHLNLKSRNSKFAQRDSMELFQNLYVLHQSKNGPIVETGVIYEIRANGFFVYLPRFGIKGPLYLKDRDGVPSLPFSFVTGDPADENTILSNSVIEVDENSTWVSVDDPALRRKRRGKPLVFKLFDHVRVTLHLHLSRHHRHSIYMTLIGTADLVQRPEKASVSDREVRGDDVALSSGEDGDGVPLTKNRLIESIRKGEKDEADQSGDDEDGEGEATVEQLNGNGVTPKNETARARKRRLRNENHRGVYDVVEHFRALSIVCAQFDRPEMV